MDWNLPDNIRNATVQVCMYVCVCVCVCVCAYNDYEIPQIDYYRGNQLLFQGITTVGYVVSFTSF